MYNNPYTQNIGRKDTTRVVVDLKDDLLAEVDKWGVPAGMRSRADTIRTLLRKGLEQEAAENVEA